MTTLVCPICKRAFDVQPSVVNKGRIHCSHACRMKQRERDFWAMADTSSDCWIWQGSKVGMGYGKTSWKSKCMRAHRLAWELVNGPIPNGLFVCHRCDNPACIRPDHLFLGTPTQNVRDMVKKARHSHGEASAKAKLTENDVREIRRRYQPRKVSLSQLADEYGVDTALVHRIVQNKIWTHVGD